MKHHYQTPHPSLSKYVRTLLILEGFAQANDNELPIFTNGMSALICRTEKDESGHEQLIQLALFGKSIPDGTWTINDNTTVVACFFHPFALSTVFNVPVSKLLKTQIDFANWNAHKTNAIKIQLFYAAFTSQKVDVINDLLIQQLEENKNHCEIIRHATDRILCSPDAEILSCIQKELNINERTFQRMFKKYVGITPNQYRQICRFQLSFTQLKSQRFNALTDIAYDNGFADQSHFIRTFREFTQITPNNYLKSGLRH